MPHVSSFTALDFETAQGYRNSICQVGLIRVEKGMMIKQISLLVQPPDNYYWKRFTVIHGITAEMTAHAPTFDKIWPVIEPYFTNQNIVAHNAAFDTDSLRQTLGYYHIPVPAFQLHCTYRLYGKGLAALCADYNIALDHHNALSDAMACAQLFLLHQQKRKRNPSIPSL